MSLIVTNKRKTEIVKTVSEIAAKYKKREDVECIYCCCYKENIFLYLDDYPFIRPSSNTGNKLVINIVFKDEVPEKANLEICADQEEYNDLNFYKKTGVDLEIKTKTSKEFAIVDKSKINFSNGDFIYEVAYGVNISNLNLSTILYDATLDNRYTKIAHQFDDNYNFKKHNLVKFIDLKFSDDQVLKKVTKAGG